jgi:hypothetical protein
MRVATAIFVFTVVLLSLRGAWGRELTGEAPEPVWWRITDSARTSDGGMIVSLSLVCPLGMKIDSSEVVYISVPGKSPASPESASEAEVYRKEISRDDGSALMSIQIYSGRTELIDLRGKFSSGGQVYYAQCVFSSYGESGTADPKAERVSGAPDWRAATLARDGKKFFYRAQTGEEITVSCGVPRASAAIFDNGSFISALKADDAGIFAYTPPHDKDLAESGYSAKKDLVFVVNLPKERAHLSFSVPVYRAFYGNTSLSGGLAVLAAFVLAALSIVITRGRRFQWR